MVGSILGKVEEYVQQGVQLSIIALFRHEFTPKSKNKKITPMKVSVCKLLFASK